MDVVGKVSGLGMRSCGARCVVISRQEREQGLRKRCLILQRENTRGNLKQRSYVTRFVFQLDATARIPNVCEGVGHLAQS